MEKTKVAGYVRISVEDRNKEKEEIESTIINQREDIKVIARENDEEIYDIYEDLYVSGDEKKRKGFNRMMEDGKNGLFNKIYVKNISRYCRDSSEFKDSLIDFNAYGVGVYSIADKKFLSPRDFGDKVKSAVEDHYLDMLREEAEKSFERKREKGLPHTRPPFGYKYHKKGWWVIDKKKAEIVIKIHTNLRKRVPKNRIMIEFGLSKSSLYSIINNIKNGVYSGKIVYKKKHTDRNKKVIRTELISYDGGHEPIL